ncbi:MAG: hypothetical protein G01um101416_270 [Microgenomates group bacterium Gr01-1014_16]|nr:MAG: hypothetical protein G01um101416_270 [Microgenomates group bacterium Gr01-1014_16]
MNLTSAQNLQYFNDLSESLSGNKHPSDHRIQVKMPRRVVKELDRLFPHIDRSRLLSQLAITAIAQSLRFQDRSILRDQAVSQQLGLNDMITYLEDRDAGTIDS